MSLEAAGVAATEAGAAAVAVAAAAAVVAAVTGAAAAATAIDRRPESQKERAGGLLAGAPAFLH